MLPSLLLATVLAVTPRWSFEDAYDNVEGGAWYMGQDNTTATLAWGESYVMSGLAAMFRATGHPMYLERLAAHVDALLLQRDDALGVTDYRGVSGACWRNTSYQDGGEPYCYAVHTGMLVYPMLEYVAALRSTPRYEDRIAADGETLGAKAERYLVAAQESVAFHDFEWNDAGYYVFAPDASFLAYAGQDQPLNQSNALGRVHVLLAELAPGGDDLTRATALASRMQSMITVGGDGAYLWNYWGGALAGDGEDVSHAAINVDFAALCAAHGIVFDEADVLGFATTFMERVYVDDATFSDWVGGGSTNDPGYRPQVGRWLAVARARTGVYTAVRDLYDVDYPPGGVGSGSILLGWALLAEHEPRLCAPYFYVVDWDDQGDARQATAYGANVLTIPPDSSRPCAVEVTFDAERSTDVGQWDGAAYHRGATWRASAGFVTRHVPYDPTWPFVYDGSGVLFQFADAFVAGEGIRVAEPRVLVAPTIDSNPELAAEIGVPWTYLPQGSGDDPHWWALADSPGQADIDPGTGAIAWTPSLAGSYSFRLQLHNDVGHAEQDFVLEVAEVGLDGSGTSGDGTSGAGSGASAAEDAAEGTEAGDTTASSAGATGLPGAGPASDPSGCACSPRGSAPPWSAWLFVLAALRRRRRSLGSCGPDASPHPGIGHSADTVLASLLLSSHSSTTPSSPSSTSTK